MEKQIIRFGVIGCGLMGKEFASAAARWCHLTDVNFTPVITAVCDANPAATAWFEQAVPTVKRAYTDYRELLADPDVDAVYCAVPHNLHAQLYSDIIRAGKHLLGEKPFGIDLEANRAAAILRALCRMEVYRELEESGWSPDEYEAWLTEALKDQLLSRSSCTT